MGRLNLVGGQINLLGGKMPAQLTCYLPSCKHPDANHLSNMAIRILVGQAVLELLIKTYILFFFEQ